jgi:hypothetical protein
MLYKYFTIVLKNKYNQASQVLLSPSPFICIDWDTADAD